MMLMRFMWRAAHPPLRQRQRLMLLLLSFVCVFVVCCGAAWGPRAVHAAPAGEDLVFASVGELTADALGAPYVFEEVLLDDTATTGSGSSSSSAGAASLSPTTSASEKGETVPGRTADAALVTMPTPAEVAVAVQRAREVGDAARVLASLSSSGGSSVATAAASHDLPGAVPGAATASACAADFTCPHASVAWASGSFTAAGVITPHSLALPVGLRLELSLCCRYKFDGSLLRSAAAYDNFLQELLQASPFQVLSAAEKRELFPQSYVYIADTWDRKRVYNTSYVLTEADVAAHNDGDGDVLVLTTGALPASGRRKLLASFLPLTTDAGSATGGGTEPAARGNFDAVSGTGVARSPSTTATAAANMDMQLRITNRVLKCKCPHILTVMPLLHVQRDTVPPLHIVGLGAHCGTPRNASAEAPTSNERAGAAPNIRLLRGPDGASVHYAVSFAVSAAVPPTSLVTWTVRRLVDTARSGLENAAAEAGAAHTRSNGSWSGNTPATFSPVVLRHTRVLPVPPPYAGSRTRTLSAAAAAAASPFFVVEPDVRYEVTVRVSRSGLAAAAPQGDGTAAAGGAAVPGATTGGDEVGGGTADSSHPYTRPRPAELERVASGRFVLRLPLNRSWAVPPVQPAPHFGFHRWVRLSNASMARPAVRAALDPFYTPGKAGEAIADRVGASATAEGPGTSGGGWFSGLGRRWGSTGGDGGAGAADGVAAVGATHAPRPLAYYGYWENTPLRDQPVPQQAVRVPANPYANTSAAAAALAAVTAPVANGDGDAVHGASVPLFLGRNLLAYVVRDVDDVCDPVVLEAREVWAVQSHIVTPGPTTACGKQQAVSALVLRDLLHRMRATPRLPVTVPNTTWAADLTKPGAAAREGQYRCESRGAGSAAQAQCTAVPDAHRDFSEVHAALRMTDRGVYEVAWVARIAVQSAQLVQPANLDPLYATVVPAPPSRARNASEEEDEAQAAAYTVEVRSRPLLVVRRLASYPRVVPVVLPMHARRWTVAAPRAVQSYAAAPTGTAAAAPATGGSGTGGDAGAVTDVLTGAAPAGQWRVRAPLRLLSVDEQRTAELDTSDVPNVHRTLPNGTLAYVAHDAGESMSLTAVVDGVTRVFTYTSRCPDTLVEYELRVVAFPPAPLVPAMAPVYTEDGCVLLTPPREVRKDEVAEWHVPACAAASQPPVLVERTLSAEEQEEERWITVSDDGGVPLAAATPHRSHPALMACGIEPYHHCDVVWSVRNLVAAVNKTYSLRRCQRPPEVVFYRAGSPAARSATPSTPADAFVLPSVTEEHYASVNASSTDAAAGAPGLVQLRRRHRRVIPIAGYVKALDYVFNFSGPQEYFELQLRPEENGVAHQLWSTRHDYVSEAEDGPLRLRRHTRTDVQLPSSGGAVGVDADARSGGNNADDTPFWRAHEQGSTAAAAAPSPPDRAGELQRQQRLRELDEQLDASLARTYRLTHDAAARRVAVAGVSNASLFPMDYAVRSAVAKLSPEAELERPEFTRRGMCVERAGLLAVLAVNPLGLVRVDERYGTTLPEPLAPAVGVLSFCAPQYTFARYPELATVYGYDFTWVCPDAAAPPAIGAAVMTVVKHHPTYSVFTHTPERRDVEPPPPSSASGAPRRRSSYANAKPLTDPSEALCQLIVRNNITRTEQREWFMVKRVKPAPLPATALIILSGNAADSLQVVAPAASQSSARARQRVATSASATQSSPTTTTATTTATRPAKGGPSSPPAMVTMEQLYTAPPNTYRFARARHIVGKSVVLHVDAPPEAGAAQWAVTSVVPFASASVGAQVLMDRVIFEAMPHHPAAVARGRSGSTVLMQGLHTPGLYSLTHTTADPQNPNVCPPVTLTDTLDVFHAQVVERELFVCGDTAALRAVPIPREIAHEFVGRWEVVSLATDATTVWTAGINFTGIVMERGTRAETLVHGLPFGVVTMRWSIYRVLPEPAPAAAASRVLVDYDTVEIYVLTENLPSHRLVTLADRAAVLVTSSTQNWKLEETRLAGASAAVAVRGAAATEVPVRMRLRELHNYSTADAAYVADAMAQGALHAYYGVQPRPGAGVLTLERLPVGTVHLRYDLVPSQSVFGRMVGHTCALRGHYEVERVSAYVTATTSMDHECDGYTGRGRITLCLHTEAAAPAATAARAGAAEASSSSARSARATRATTAADVHFWQSQVRLIDPAALEATIKHGAREVETLSGGRCATPWWTAPSSQWSGAAYTAVSADPAGALPGRCVTFAVRAGRHLSPREVAQPLFSAWPRPAASTAATPSTSLYSDAAAAAAQGGDAGAAAAAGVCPYHGDFITTRVIADAPGTEAGGAAASAAAAAAASEGAASSSRFGLAQLFRLGLPHTVGGDGGDGGARAARMAQDRDVWGIRFLPVLQPATLRRANATMRPMVGRRGVPDDVATEVGISGPTARPSGGDGEHGGADGALNTSATVLLRLDLSHPRHHGGYTVFPSPASSTPATNTSTAETASGDRPASAPPQQQSLLYKCVEGTVRGADVLQYWTETNRPDGRVDRTAQEWLEYAAAVREAAVPCDVLFGSLDHLIAETLDEAGSGAVGAWHGRLRRGGRHPQHARSTGSGTEGLPAYISLAEMEQQVERIRRQYRWTADGIDVTGLPGDLQSALSHRRVTSTQLRAIEAARNARQAAEAAAAAAERTDHQRGLQSAPSRVSPMERLTSALQAYHGIAQGGEVAVLRIQLPLLPSFTVPYDVFLRTALHKDVVCGTAVDPPPAMTDAPVQPTVANPHSLVPLGRLEVRDAAPVLAAYPPVVKQCEVEGGMPVLTFELTGANFAAASYDAAAVTLEEIANPALEHPAGQREDGSLGDVGLAPCLADMRRGFHAAVEARSRKRLYVQLGACPSFKMLTQEEYNEHQDSETLLRRLQQPRYLRVTVRRAIQPDSFLAPAATARAAAAANTSAHAWVPGRPVPSSATATSTDAAFVVEVRPTLARLHLRASAGGNPRDAATGAASLEDENSGGGGWWDSAGRLLSSTISSPNADGAGHAGDGVRAADGSATLVGGSPRAFEPTPNRPLVLCEADLRQHGFQLGIELIGDTWTAPVGEPWVRHREPGSGAYPPGDSYPYAQRQRAPPNVALMNSFSIVEHHSLDSSHHLYIKGGGVYRSHFMNYLFGELLTDPSVLHQHAFVHRYNDSFAVIAVPPMPIAAGAAAPSDSSAARARALPAVRQFCKIEEILFAVPGIATECRGCLLADTTFYVAGDLTGLWTHDSPLHGGAGGGAAPAAAAAAAAAEGGARLPRSRWAADVFTRPLVLPWDSAVRVPRVWQLDWVCPTAALRAMQELTDQRSSRDAGASLSFVLDVVVVYRLRGVDGAALPAARRPSVLLSSTPVGLADVVRQRHTDARRAQVAAPLTMQMNESAAAAAFTVVAEDALRHRRHVTSALEYHRDGRYADGLLVVNASVVLKVCAEAACMVVSISDALLALEAPRPAAPAAASRSSTSLLGRLLRIGGDDHTADTHSRRSRSPLSLPVLLHHGLMTFLVRELLPVLGLVVVSVPAGSSTALSESLLEDQRRAHNAFTVMVFIFIFAVYAYAPALAWMGLYLAVWTFSLYAVPRPELILLFAGSVVYAHYLL